VCEGVGVHVIEQRALVVCGTMSYVLVDLIIVAPYDRFGR
jgi:hypothetical protein